MTGKEALSVALLLSPPKQTLTGGGGRQNQLFQDSGSWLDISNNQGSAWWRERLLSFGSWAVCVNQWSSPFLSSSPVRMVARVPGVACWSQGGQKFGVACLSRPGRSWRSRHRCPPGFGPFGLQRLHPQRLPEDLKNQNFSLTHPHPTFYCKARHFRKSMLGHWLTAEIMKQEFQQQHATRNKQRQIDIQRQK